MGANVSRQNKSSRIPSLSEDSDDSEDDGAASPLILPLPLDKSKGKSVTDEERVEDISIVFFDDDVEDENDLYYDGGDLCTDSYKCFGVPFLNSISPPLFTMAAATTAFTETETSRGNGNNNVDEDEDSREDIESLQLELQALDSIFNHEDEDDEDPEESVESLQRELQKADANYVVTPAQETKSKATAPKDNDPVSRSSARSVISDGQESQLQSRPQFQQPSSFINLQQLLFSSGEDDHSSISKNGSVASASSMSMSASNMSLFSSSSSSTCRIVEIYETRTTQLRPQPESEKERVPFARRGVPFRKCRNPSCSCHHPRSTSTSTSSTNNFGGDSRNHHRHSNSNRNSNRSVLEAETYLSNTNFNDRYVDDDVDDNDDDNDNDSSSLEARRLKKRSALHRLRNQREKLLAMDDFEDDQTEVTAGSSSSSSRYSEYSVRSDCQINTRKNIFLQNKSNCIGIGMGNGNSEHGHRRQRSLSEDYNERGNHTRTAISASASSPYPILPQLLVSSTTIPISASSHDSCRRKQTKEQPSPSPPHIPSRQAFGRNGNHKHKTYPLPVSQSSRSYRKMSSDSCPDNNDTSETPRRCRSEDFIDGTSAFGGGGGSSSSSSGGYCHGGSCSIVESSGIRKLITESAAKNNGSKRNDRDSGIVHSSKSGLMSMASGNKRSIRNSAVAPDQEEDDRGVITEEGKNLSFLRSPTCIIEEIHHNDSYSQSRPTKNQHQHLVVEQRGRLLQQLHDPTTKKIPIGLPAATSGIHAHVLATANLDDRDDNPHSYRLFDEREQSLKECRQSVRFLLNQERIDRHHKIIMANQKQKQKDSRKQQKWRRQQQQQREFKRAMQLADIYHNMGLIHYQQGRYETARHVLQCGVDALIAHRASSVPCATEAFEETTDPFDDDYAANPSYHNYAASPSRLLPVLPTLDEAAPHLASPALLLAAELILAQGKSFAAQGLWYETKQSSGKVLQWSSFQQQRLLGQHQHPNHATGTEDRHKNDSNKYWKDWGPTTARAQVLFARCFEHEHRPDIAMWYYQKALSVQRCVLGPRHVQVADTLYRMGNLHAAAGMLGLAKQCYDEALWMYRRHRSKAPNSPPPRLNINTDEEHHRKHCYSKACIAADEATVLAGLGWIFLVQRDLGMALALTNEALDGMVQALGSSHRNVLSLRHQLACIQNSFVAANANVRANMRTNHH